MYFKSYSFTKVGTVSNWTLKLIVDTERWWSSSTKSAHSLGYTWRKNRLEYVTYQTSNCKYLHALWCYTDVGLMIIASIVSLYRSVMLKNIYRKRFVIFSTFKSIFYNLHIYPYTLKFYFKQYFYLFQTIKLTLTKILLNFCLRSIFFKIPVINNSWHNILAPKLCKLNAGEIKFDKK